MIHTVLCTECWKNIEFELAGDLAQYGGDLLDCPCKGTYIVPRYTPDGYVLFSIGDLVTPVVDIENKVVDGCYKLPECEFSSPD